MIQLTKEQLEELKKFINTIPTMYGVPLLNFFGQLEQEQTKPEDKIISDGEQKAE